MGKQSEVTLWIKIKETGSAVIESLTHGLKEFGSGFFELKNLALEAAAVILEQFGEHLVHAFADAEQGIIRLNAALRVSGRYTDEGSTQIQEMAEKMSHLTDVTKDAAIGISATMALYAKTLTTDQLANVQQAVIGLHALTGMDIEAASMRIAKTLGGQGNALKKLGIDIDTTATQQEKYNEVMRKLAPAFTVAEEMNNSLAGQFTQFNHALEEGKKALGQVIIESLNLGDKSQGLTKKIEGWTKSINENMGTWVHWGQIIFAVLQSVWQFVIFVGRDLWNFGQIMYRAIKLEWEALYDIGVAIMRLGPLIGAVLDVFWEAVRTGSTNVSNWVIGIFNTLITKFNEFSPVKLPLFTTIENDSKESLDAATARMTAARDHFTDAFKDIGTAAKSTWKDIQGDLGDLDDNANKLYASYQRIIDLWNKPIRPNAAFDRSHAGGGANLGEKQGDDPAQAAKNLEEQLKLLKQRFADNEIGVNDYVKGVAKLAPALKAVYDELNDGKHQQAFTQFSGAVGSVNKELQKLGYTFDEKTGTVRMLSVMENLGVKMREAAKNAGTLQKVIADMADKTFGGLMTAVQSAFQAMIDGSKSAGQAFAQAMLGALGQVAQGFGQFFMGRAIGALAEAFDPAVIASGGSAAALASAAKFTAGATAMFALSGVLGGLGSRAGGSGGGGGGGAAAAQQQTQQVSSTKLAGTIIVEGGLLDMSDPRQADALSQALTDLTGRRIIIKAGP